MSTTSNAVLQGSSVSSRAGHGQGSSHSSVCVLSMIYLLDPIVHRRSVDQVRRQSLTAALHYTRDRVVPHTDGAILARCPSSGRFPSRSAREPGAGTRENTSCSHGTSPLRP